MVAKNINSLFFKEKAITFLIALNILLFDYLVINAWYRNTWELVTTCSPPASPEM